MTITFLKIPEDLKNMASYISQLIKEGVGFEMKDLQDRVDVTLTGGF